MGMTKKQTIIFFILISIITLLFIMSSFLKLTGDPKSIEGFAEIGLPLWFMYVVGATELLGAIGLWIGKARRWAIRALAVIMIGAIVLVLIYKTIILTIVPLIVLALLATICWLDRGMTKTVIK